MGLIADVVLLLVSFGVILLGAELFTNAIEWFGKKLGLGTGMVGSVLAAVGTALPETMIPIIAILFAGGEASHEVGIGAILGAPFMLSTLAMFVTGMGVLAFRARRATEEQMRIDAPTLIHDVRYFAIAYAIAGARFWTGIVVNFVALIGYALVGPSRQLMVGPDTGTCIMLAGVLGTLGAVSEGERVDLTLALTMVVGVLCFGAGVLRLGFLANFLSRPMLVGFLGQGRIAFLQFEHGILDQLLLDFLLQQLQRQLKDLHRLDHPRRQNLLLELAGFKAEGETHDERLKARCVASLRAVQKICLPASASASTSLLVYSKMLPVVIPRASRWHRTCNVPLQVIRGGGHAR